MFNEEKFFERIHNVHPGNYDLCSREWCAIYERYSGRPFEMSYDTFRYGFLKGQRAARAEMKKMNP